MFLLQVVHNAAPAKSEVADFDIIVLSQEYIGRLDVPVHQPCCMNELNATHNFIDHFDHVFKWLLSYFIAV
jgi:hypothetical protein